MTASEYVLVLRCNAADGTSLNGFRWPELGPVECPDWDPKPECGHGLHGWLWGEGDAACSDWSRVPDARWYAVRVLAVEVVDLKGKVKFLRGEVMVSGTSLEATDYIRLHGGAGRAIIAGHATAGYNGKATAGYNGQATAGYNGQATAGDYGQATAGDYGQATAGNYGQATAGNYGHATAGDYGQATAGNYGQATAGYNGKATAGYNGQATAGYYGHATAGYNGQATAGDYGTIQISFWDVAASRCRVLTGYVGESGIEANVPYRVVDGALVSP